MRRSNWKGKVLVIVSFIIGVIAGAVVAVNFPEEYQMYRGLATFGTIAVVSVLLMVTGVKILKIGRD